MDKDKVINELVEHIESALAVDSDYVDCVRTDLLQTVVGLLKEQESWINEIAEYKQSVSSGMHELDDYEKGKWDGLQIAWNIISEGR